MTIATNSEHVRTGRGPSLRQRRHHRSLGQSVVEFGLIVPVLLTITGATVDLARLYQGWITLEGATRDAAEYVATNGSDSGLTAQQTAQRVVCTEMAAVAGFVAPAGNPSACTSPAVTLSSYTTNTAASAGGSTNNPVGSATVAATFGFKTLFPYP